MKIYLVGGAIRNNLLKLPIKDKDWVVVGSNIKVMLDKNYQQVGKDFPVFIHPKTGEEYALARIDQKIGLGHKGFRTNCSSKVTLKEDLLRRDITINAIAQDSKGNYIDPYNGINDINKRVIKHVSKAFQEDPLRVLRVARFAAFLSHLGFYVFHETMIFMKKIVNNGEIKNISIERIWKETEKALKSKNPEIYFEILYKCGALSILFPEIYILYNIKHHKQNINIGKMSLFLLSKISKITNKIDVKFSSFFYYISKQLYENKNVEELKYIYSYNLALKICKRLKIPKKTKKLVICISRFSGFISNIYKQTSEEIISFFNIIDVWRNPKIIKKIVFCIDIYQIKYFSYKKIYYNPATYLNNLFIISKKINITKILKLGLKGINIRNEINRLRVNIIEKWRNDYKKNFLTNVK
ncbi:hypothetical protein RJX39_00235 [Buchnera aphidicola (Taiwanaphis decaspermi)]|uniref:hypothetical protein n=1 Tax=Buchnera aphidicola TaxID=9 RepID=UPI0031B838BB